MVSAPTPLGWGCCVELDEHDGELVGVCVALSAVASGWPGAPAFSAEGWIEELDGRDDVDDRALLQASVGEAGR